VDQSHFKAVKSHHQQWNAVLITFPNIIAEKMSRKHNQKTVSKMDAADEKSHSMEKAKEHAYFSLACTSVMNTHLLRSLKESNASSVAERWEWDMRCPICESFLGCWICVVDTSEIKLSGNQQRKNRNTALLAKSHYKKYHALEKAISLVQSHERLRNAPAAQSKQIQVTPVASTLPPKISARHSQGVKRKSDNTAAVSKKLRTRNATVSNKPVDSKTDEADKADESTESTESSESVEPPEIPTMNRKINSDSKPLSHLSKQSNSYPVHDRSAYHSGASIPLSTKAASSPMSAKFQDRESKAPASAESRGSSSNENVQKVTKVYNLKPTQFQPTHDADGFYLGPDLKPRLDKPRGWVPGCDSDEEDIDDSY